MSRSTTADDHIPARTDAAAKKRFLEVLQRSLSVVHQGQWVLIPKPTGGFGATTVPGVVPLKTNDESLPTLYLRSSIEGEYVDDLKHEGDRKVSTHRYAHTIGETPELSQQLYSWEWVSTEPTYPHLHVRRADPAFQGLGKKHIPTGRVFFEDVLRFVIMEHAVRTARRDWDEVLTECLRRVGSHASWGGRHR